MGQLRVAELQSDAGYATSLFGKWHLGEVEGRLPTDQGFDEWWGYKNSTDETAHTSYATYRAIAKAKARDAQALDLEVRPLLDKLIVDKATDFIQRTATSDRPFFTYVGLSNVHPPEKAHPDFDQTETSRLGLYADLSLIFNLFAAGER
jgi:arylsulfatase A-like enzyme